MIKIGLDEGYAYDLLSIAAVKVAKHAGNRANLANHHRLEAEIITQVGADLHCEIMDSTEYADLYQTNLALFNHIDEMKTRPPQAGDAQFVDHHNYQRYLHKKAIQARFFPNSPLAEQKLGYTT